MANKGGRERSKICGIGINDLPYVGNKSELVNGKWKTTWMCPYYARWMSMIHRCYLKANELNYADKFVAEEWWIASKFKSWMEQQDWEGKDLDKDLLVENNKIYSAETCVFVSKEINNFLVKSTRGRGLYPLGVSYDKSKLKFEAYISHGNTKKFLGRFKDPLSAHAMWQKEKISQCENLICKESNPRILLGLSRVKNKIESDYSHQRETVTF